MPPFILGIVEADTGVSLPASYYMLEVNRTYFMLPSGYTKINIVLQQPIHNIILKNLLFFINSFI